LSPGQEALWLLHRRAPEAAAYVIGGAGRLQPDLDRHAFRRAFHAVVARHGALRTVLPVVDGEPRQVESPESGEFYQVVDGSVWTAAEVPERVAELAFRPFDLGAGPLFRVFVVEDAAAAGAAPPILILNLHHTVGDLWSIAVFMTEVGKLTARFAAGGEGSPGDIEEILGPAPPSYGELSERRAEELAGEEGDRLRQAWLDHLGERPPVPLELPTDRPRPPVQTFAGAMVSARLGQGLRRSLGKLARGRGTNLFTALMAGWQAVLHRLTDQSGFAVGSPTSGRLGASSAPGELARAVGYFVNPVPVVAPTEGDPSFAELLDRVARETEVSLAHQGLPLPLLVELLEERGGLAADPSRSPLFQTLLVLQKSPIPGTKGLGAFALGREGDPCHLDGVELTSLDFPQRGAQFDLALYVLEEGAELTGSLEYNTDLFDRPTAERMLERLATLLQSAADAPERPLSRLALLSEGERRELLADLAPGGILPAGWGRTAPERFAAQARTTPDAVALVAGERRFSYAQLDRAVGRLAGRLRRLGVGPEARVGLFASRTAEMVVGLLAVHRAGGAYVPMDPAYPADRIALVAEDSRMAVLLTERALAGRLGEGRADDFQPNDLQRVELDGVLDAPDPGEATADVHAVDPDHLSHVIYTSGSTGRPKGVAIAHRGVAALLAWAEGLFGDDEVAAVAATTSTAFDLSVFELLVPLTRGGAVHLAADALALADLPSRDEITLVNTVPSAAAALADQGGLPPRVRTVNLAGEPLRQRLVDALFDPASGAAALERVRDLYGPSEDTTYSTGSLCPAGSGSEPTIGRPVDGTHAYVVDGRGELVARGVPGELLLAGVGLARGYLARPGLTAERFTPDPWGDDPGARLYRTGDLVRWGSALGAAAGGELEFLGRADHQVKVRGFRIEPGEIEVALEAHPTVAEAAVAAVGDGAERSLVAWVAGAERDGIDVAILREHLGSTLPAYMVPGRFLVLEALPRTPNGKLDRRALPAPDLDDTSRCAEFVAPETEVEELIADIWREVLGVERIGIHDSFFELGGHSLKANQVLLRIEEMFGIEVPIPELFKNPTIAGLTRALAEALMAEAQEDEVAGLLG
jgi:amino acid adenylation domain-containing protein